MKTKLLSLFLLVPVLFAGCDLFDKGEVEKTYDGPDQLGFFPLEDNNTLGLNVTSTTIQVQLISADGLAKSDIPVAFSVAGSSTARAGTDYSFGTPSPITIGAGTATADIVVNFVVSTLAEASVDAVTGIDSARAFGTYAGLTATGASGTGFTFDVTVPVFGDVASVDTLSGPDSAWTAGTYMNVAATGGSGSGATFDITIAEYGQLVTFDQDSASSDSSATRVAGEYRNRSVTGGSGQFASVDVIVDAGGVATVTLNNAGIEFVVGDTLVVSGTDAGGLAVVDDIKLVVTEVGAISAPTVVINEAGSRYLTNDELTISAADIGMTGADLTFDAVDVGQIVAPTVTVVTGGTGYVASDTFTVADADLGAGGASSFVFEVDALTGSFPDDEVQIDLVLDSGNTVQVAANLGASTVFMAKD